MARKPKTPKWLRAARAQNRSPGSTFDWISRAMARAGVMPAPEAARAIAAQRVRVNGEIVSDPLAAVEEGDRVELDGIPVSLRAPTRGLMFHKPAGIVTDVHDPENRGTVFEALLKVLPSELSRYGWHAIGRLDRDTTGLLLFTNDERLVAHVTSPKTHLPKRYLARVSGTPSDEKLEPLRQGITLEDGPTMPAEAATREDGRVELTIHEGRHHQVKRMLAAVGLPVVNLHREAIGTLTLDVEVGQWRELREDEVRRDLRFNSTELIS